VHDEQQAERFEKNHQGGSRDFFRGRQVGGRQGREPGHYSKFVRTSSKFMAHDEENTCNEGDRVLIEECRPLSKRKRWLVRKVLERAQ